MRSSAKENLLSKVVRLADMLDLKQIVPPRGLVAIKLHFGEKGTPPISGPPCSPDRGPCQSLGAFPFLTDANTLYVGTRADSVSHLHTAVETVSLSVVNAPLIIADGLRGASYAAFKIQQEVVKTAYVGKEIAEADGLISLAISKATSFPVLGHPQDLGMGCASRRGKMVQHADVSPKITRKKAWDAGVC